MVLYLGINFHIAGLILEKLKIITCELKELTILKISRRATYAIEIMQLIIQKNGMDILIHFLGISACDGPADVMMKF